MTAKFVRGEIICINKLCTRKCTIHSLTTHVGFCVLTKKYSRSWPIACLTRISTKKHGKRSAISTLITSAWLTGSIRPEISYRQLDYRNSMKDTILAGDLTDVFPYLIKRHFSVRFRNDQFTYLPGKLEQW